MSFMRKDLKLFINKEIKPLYKAFDKAHNLSHYKFVTNNCLEYSKELIKQGFNINLEIAFVVGAYHDVGLIFGRENHAKSSGEYVRKDKKLKTFFNEDTIETIAQAVEDHSSHLTYEPRNIYGKIVADADRNNSVYLVFSRPIKYGLKHEKNSTKQEHIERVYNFVNEKFGRNGYVKYWLNLPQTTKAQNEVWQLLDNKDICLSYISGIYDEVINKK
ncbi:MAG: HD domain-containing protein [Clostridia bacterium]|nr:HD domain-containing protein [Clostridia bacterium]